MKKILTLLVLVYSITIFNIANWFFPEYEEEIKTNWKILIDTINNQTSSSDNVYIENAKEIVKSWKIKNKKEKLLLNEFITIMDREPVALNATWTIEGTWTIENASTTDVINNNLISLATTSSTYNRTNAVNYAITWATWRNPNYNFYAWLNDCTNFTSQVLQAWWLPYIVSWVLWKYDTKNWYYANTSNASPSFTWWWANNFYSHALYYTSKFKVAATFWELQIWDIIQIDWTRDWTIDHSMVVRSKSWTSTSQIYVTYHSTDTPNRQLSNLINEYPNAKYIWWKIIY